MTKPPPTYLSDEWSLLTYHVRLAHEIEALTAQRVATPWWRMFERARLTAAINHLLDVIEEPKW